MRVEDFAKRADQLIEMADVAIKTQFQVSWSKYVENGAFAGFRSASLSFLLNVFGSTHPYFKDFDTRVSSNALTCARAGREILVAAKAEVVGGWTSRVRSLVAAEIFSDFLAMAEYLLAGGYKDAAAVMIGSTLEEHLRQLCNRHDIPVEVIKDGKPVPKKADLLNSELAAASVYGKLDQKAVTAWLDLRNKAAHGRYEEYSDGQVQAMYQGATEFMARVAP